MDLWNGALGVDAIAACPQDFSTNFPSSQLFYTEILCLGQCRRRWLMVSIMIGGVFAQMVKVHVEEDRK